MLHVFWIAAKRSRAPAQQPDPQLLPRQPGAPDPVERAHRIGLRHLARDLGPELLPVIFRPVALDLVRRMSGGHFDRVFLFLFWNLSLLRVSSKYIPPLLSAGRVRSFSGAPFARGIEFPASSFPL